MIIELKLNSNIGILGVERTKGLFITYNSFKYGKIELEFFKNKNNGKYYYLIDNLNISNFLQGKEHDDIMVIHNKLEKAILKLLNNKKVDLKKEFNYKKYRNDFNNFNILIDFIKNNSNILKEYIEGLKG